MIKFNISKNRFDVRGNIHKDLLQCPANPFNMSVKGRTKYMVFDGCGSARLASPEVCGQVRKLEEKMSPITCQELQGCVGGCMELVDGKEFSTENCLKFDDCVSSCTAKAHQKPIQYKAATKAKSPVKPARAPPITPAKEESGYATLRRQYNRLLGVHQRPPVRTSQKSTEPEEGSPEYFIAQHDRALGRKRFQERGPMRIYHCGRRRPVEEQS